MKREIRTRPIEPSRMKEELAFLIDHFQKLGHEYCDVTFGYAWGLDYYKTNDWPPVWIPLAHLPQEIERVEGAGWGSLGDNDLNIRPLPLPLEFLFCHESDIHLSFDEPDDTTSFFFQRWMKAGFSPMEQEIEKPI